jgi:uncharacterized RDD family membrane protein YckC
MARRSTGCLFGDMALPLAAPLARPTVLPSTGSATGTSAAQNGPVIRICSKCGALLLEDTEKCSFCKVLLDGDDSNSEPVAVGVSASEDAEEPEWRLEVARRLELYRARQRQLHPDDSQSGLPFSRSSELEEEVRERPRQRPSQRQRQIERVEICIQPELDFQHAPDDRAHPQSPLVPVADLVERRRAGALDALFLVLTYAGFLGLFRSLGGQITLERVDAVVYLTAFYLLYAQYFFLFTTFAGATPGMQLRCLTIVRLDGTLPDTSQLLWRSFGYLLSGATLMLGFLWALWDEDHFAWQDRISQTYITAATPVVESDSFEIPAGHHTFAHK